MEQFGQHFTSFNSSATRIETLDMYQVEEEKEQFARYLAGDPIPPNRNEEWAGNIREAVAAGKYMGRVHIIPDALTPYLQFEIDWYYAVNGAAGEDIRFIFRDDVPDLVYTDTWLFDNETVLDLSYDPAGHLLYVNKNDDPARLEQARTAWEEFYRRSFPLSTLMARVRGSDRAVPRT
ncbi:DUF6879 family protein [Streptomyces sp. NPDC091219]|uniref:DUF6879 family protein n=1 Tax=Streptomyces sp. NPDC091219 TaxID=3155193 RepID=UPI00344FA1DF